MHTAPRSTKFECRTGLSSGSGKPGLGPGCDFARLCSQLLSLDQCESCRISLQRKIQTTRRPWRGPPNAQDDYDWETTRRPPPDPQDTAQVLSPTFRWTAARLPPNCWRDSRALPTCFPHVLGRFRKIPEHSQNASLKYWRDSQGLGNLFSQVLPCTVIWLFVRHGRTDPLQSRRTKRKIGTMPQREKHAGERCVQDMAQECWPTLSPLQRPRVGTTLCGTSRPGDTGSTTTITTNAATTTANTTATARKTARTTRAARMNIRD